MWPISKHGPIVLKPWKKMQNNGNRLAYWKIWIKLDYITLINQIKKKKKRR